LLTTFQLFPGILLKLNKTVNWNSFTHPTLFTFNERLLSFHALRELDMLNLMCYDFKIYSTESKLIGHHSPLHPKSTDSESDKLLTVVCTELTYILSPVEELFHF